MKKQAIFAAVITLCLSTSAGAFAQNMGRGDDMRRGPGGPGDDMRRGPGGPGGPGDDMRRGGPGGPGFDRGQPGPQGRNDRERYEANHDANRGAGPRHDFRKGGRLPSEYRNRQYVVNDWRGHRLNAPPRGYQWVQAGGDYVLAAIATGVIAQIILNN
ncbi:MAG: RcnB family protein [Janthinobacterium lividum]